MTVLSFKREHSVARLTRVSLSYGKTLALNISPDLMASRMVDLIGPVGKLSGE